MNRSLFTQIGVEHRFNTSEKIENTGCLKRIEYLVAAFGVTDYSGIPENRKMTGYGRDVISYQRGQVTDASFTFLQLLDNKKPRWVREGFNDRRTGVVTG